MKKINEIIEEKYKNGIKLENKNILFQIKLLQYNINRILFKHKQKYALNEYIKVLEEEIITTTTQANINELKGADEVLNHIKAIIKGLREYKNNNTPSKEDINSCIDSTLKYILYKWAHNKTEYKVNDVIELIGELNQTQRIISTYKIEETARIKNSKNLLEQLKERLNVLICDL